MYKYIGRLALLSCLLCFSYEVTAEEPQAGQDDNKVETTDSNDEARNVITDKIFDVWWITPMRSEKAIETFIQQGSIKMLSDGNRMYLKTVVERTHPDELFTQDELTLYGILNTIFHKIATKKGLTPAQQKQWVAFDTNTKCRSVAGIWLECMSCYEAEVFRQKLIIKEQGLTK